MQTHLYIVEVAPCIVYRSSTTSHSSKASLTLTASGLRGGKSISNSTPDPNCHNACNHEAQHVHCTMKGQLFSVQQLWNSIHRRGDSAGQVEQLRQQVAASPAAQLS